LALSFEGHAHHTSARAWFDGVENARIFFCRHTQLGLLRLLSLDAVMCDEAMSQEEAWESYDALLEDDRIDFIEEPLELEQIFRGMSQLQRPAPKDWADSYLAAFSITAQLTLVTFDRTLRGKVKSGLLLGS
jgi:uncharacterized protein